MKTESIKELQQMKRSDDASNVVRVSVPPSVYYHLESIQKIQAAVLGRLGCLACCSGLDIRFDLERIRFNVDQKLNIKETRLSEIG